MGKERKRDLGLRGTEDWTLWRKNKGECGQMKRLTFGLQCRVKTTTFPMPFALG